MQKAPRLRTKQEHMREQSFRCCLGLKKEKVLEGRKCCFVGKIQEQRESNQGGMEREVIDERGKRNVVSFTKHGRELEVRVTGHMYGNVCMWYMYGHLCS